MAELMFGLNQTKKKKVEEQKVRTTKANLKDVQINDTIEKEIRKDHHARDQKWKEVGRNQKKENTNFDMARSLFGGGGPAPNLEDDEEEVEIHQEIVSDDQNEDGEEAQVDVYDESEGEYVEEEYSEEDGDDSHSH